MNESEGIIEKEKSITERLQNPLQVLAISLSILGIFLYIFGYAYYWGVLDAYDLSALEFPLEFDGYIAMGFWAVVAAFHKIVGSFDWVSILAHYSFLIIGSMVVIILLGLLVKYFPDFKDREISFSNKLVKPLEKVAGFFYPVKEMIFIPYFAILGYFVIFVIISLLLIFPLMFFMIGNDRAKDDMNTFHCNEDVAGCTIIKTEKDTWVGIIIANEKGKKSLFDGSKTIHIQKKNIISEEYFLKETKSKVEKSPA